MSIAERAAALGLTPDPRGGWSRLDADGDGPPRALHLLGVGDCLEWHRVDGAGEGWTHLEGGPLALTVSPNGHDATAFRLGPNAAMGERARVDVPDGHWRAAEPLGAWTLLALDHDRPGAARVDAPPGWRPVPRAPGG